MVEREARIEMIKVCKKLYQNEYTLAYDGNVSIKLDNNRILITPSGFCKGDLTERDLIVCDKDGKKIEGMHKPSSEIRIHVEAYRQRPDIGAVIHAHPPLATAFSLAGVSLAHCLLPEVILYLGTIPTTKYATPTTEEGPNVIRDLIKTNDALILDRHGSLTVGKDVWSAYYKLEKIEHTAKITFIARQLGSIKTLRPEQLNRVIAIAKEFGVPGEAIQCQNCGGCGKPIPEDKKSLSFLKNDDVIDTVSTIIAKEISKMNI